MRACTSTNEKEFTNLLVHATPGPRDLRNIETCKGWMDRILKRKYVQFTRQDTSEVIPYTGSSVYTYVFPYNRYKYQKMTVQIIWIKTAHEPTDKKYTVSILAERSCPEKTISTEEELASFMGKVFRHPIYEIKEWIEGIFREMGISPIQTDNPQQSNRAGCFFVKYTLHPSHCYYEVEHDKPEHGEFIGKYMNDIIIHSPYLDVDRYVSEIWFGRSGALNYAPQDTCGFVTKDDLRRHIIRVITRVIPIKFRPSPESPNGLIRVEHIYDIDIIRGWIEEIFKTEQIELTAGSVSDENMRDFSHSLTYTISHGECFVQMPHDIKPTRHANPKTLKSLVSQIIIKTSSRSDHYAMISLKSGTDYKDLNFSSFEDLEGKIQRNVECEPPSHVISYTHFCLDIHSIMASVDQILEQKGILKQRFSPPEYDLKGMTYGVSFFVCKEENRKSYNMHVMIITPTFDVIGENPRLSAEITLNHGNSPQEWSFRTEGELRTIFEKTLPWIEGLIPSVNGAAIWTRLHELTCEAERLAVGRLRLY